MRLKKLAVVVGTLGVAGLCAACGTTNNSSSISTSSKLTIKSGTITVATSGTLSPTSYHDSKTNKLTGYDVEVMRAVAKKLHLKIRFKEYGVDGQKTAVKTGKADVAVDDFSISKEKLKMFRMSIAIKHSFDAILVRSSDSSNIHSWKDLKGKKSAGEAGTIYQRLAQQLGAKVVNYDNVANSVYIKGLLSGKTDFIMNDYYLLTMHHSKGTKILKNMYFTTNESENGEGILINKNNARLQRKINQALKALKKSGQLSKIAKKFYGKDVTKNPSVKISKHFTISSKYTGE